jgi:hypothetical protein
MRVVEPRRDWDGVVRVEDIGRRRVVQDNRVGNWTAQLRQVLQTIVLYPVFTKRSEVFTLT